MSGIMCRKCGSNLEDWNNAEYVWINYCPNCGIKLLKKQQYGLRQLTMDEDIDSHIRGNLLDMFDNYSGELDAAELADCAWEAENCDSVMFYSNYVANRFVMRHMHWVDEALEYVCDNFGNAEYYAKMKAECNDRFLVVAFTEATRKYLYDQLGINQDGGKLSKKRTREIIKQIKDTPYQAEW